VERDVPDRADADLVELDVGRFDCRGEHVTAQVALVVPRPLRRVQDVVVRVVEEIDFELEDRKLGSRLELSRYGGSC
jgi:hypothetical protein